MHNETIKKHVPVFLYTGLASAIQFVFMILTARWSSVEEFGVFNACMSIFVYFGISAVTIENTMSRHIALHPEQIHHARLRAFILQKSLFYILPLEFMSFFFIKYSMHIENMWTIIFLLVAVMVYAFLAYDRGVLAGSKNFSSMGFSYLLESVFRVIGLWVISIFFVIGSQWSMFSVLIAACAAYLYTRYIIKEMKDQHLQTHKKTIRDKHNEKNNERKEIEKNESKNKNVGHWVLTTIIANTVLQNSDVLVAKMKFSSHAVGLYSAASFTEKIMLTIVSTVSLVMLPHFTTMTTIKARQVILATAGLILLFIGIGWVLSVLFGQMVMTILYGSSYSVDSFLSPWFVLLGSSLGLLTIMSNVYIAFLDKKGILLFISSSVIYFLFLFIEKSDFQSYLPMISIFISLIAIIHLCRILFFSKGADGS